MTHTFKVFRHRLPAMSSLPYHHFDCPYHQCIPTNSPRVRCRLLPQAQSHVNPAVYLAGLAATDFTISPWLDLTADSTISPCRYSQTSSTLSPASSAHFRRLTWRLTVLTSGGFVLTDSDRTMSESQNRISNNVIKKSGIVRFKSSHQGTGVFPGASFEANAQRCPPRGPVCRRGLVPGPFP
jgi:hypothetical protein